VKDPRTLELLRAAVAFVLLGIATTVTLLHALPPVH